MYLNLPQSPALFLIIILIILTFNPISLCYSNKHHNNNNDPRYEACFQNSSNCGNSHFKISYPFWGNGRPQYCGHPGFNLSCEGSNLKIKIMNGTYNIININYNTSTFQIVDDQFSTGACPDPGQVLHNTTLDWGLFNYTSSVKNASLFYDCPSMYEAYMAAPFTFSCAKRYPKNPVSFIVISDDWMYELGKLCRVKVYVPIHNSTFKNLIYNSPSFTVGDVLKTGFEIKWVIDQGHCQKCYKSGGCCGFNTTLRESVCFCENGAYQDECPQPTTLAVAEFAKNKLPKEMTGRISAAAIKARRVKSQIEAKEIPIPPPPQDPKHPKKPSIGVPIKRGRETNPFAEEQKDKKMKAAVVEAEQPQSEEGVFQKDAATEAALVAAGKVIRPSSSKEVPAGRGKHFLALTQKERNRRRHGAFRTIYSPDDEEYIMGGDGEEVFNDLHNAWLDMSIRMYAASKYMLKNKGNAPSPDELLQAKEDLAQEKAAHASTKQSLEEQLEAARADLAAANASITDLEGKLADAISQRDCVNRAKNQALEDLSKARKSLKKAQKAKDRVLEEKKIEEEAIINRWLQSEAGEKYKTDLLLDGAAEAADVLITDTLDRAKKVVEEMLPGQGVSFESRYHALEKEEEAPVPEARIIPSSPSEGGDLEGVSGPRGGKKQQQQPPQPQQPQQQQPQPANSANELLEELNICID